MDYSQSEIRREIESTRAGMVEKISALEARMDGAIEEMKHWVNPKYHVEHRPWLMMGVSLVAGYLTSRLIFPRRGTRRGVDYAAAGRAVHAQQSSGVIGGLVSAVVVALARDAALNLLTRRSARPRGQRGHSTYTTSSRGLQ